MLDAIDIPIDELPSEGSNPKDLINRLADLMLRKPSVFFELVFGLICFCIALYLRFVVDGSLPPGFPFLTFFPAVLLTAVFASLRAGVVVAIFGGLAAWYFFVAPIQSFILTEASATAMVFYALIVVTELMLLAAMKLALARLRVTEKKSAALAQSRALMFSELQHRVSNNLAVVSALLRLQAGQSKDPQAKQVLSEAQVRINTIARLQRRLHSPNIQSVEVAAFLRDMAEDTIQVAGAGAGVTLRFDLHPVQVPHEQAIPIGLIASELLMNAVEHSSTNTAVAGPQACVIRISLTSSPTTDGQLVTLEVHDSGNGLDQTFDITKTKSLGLNIARQFATQLQGELTLSNAAGGGTVARLQFQT